MVIVKIALLAGAVMLAIGFGAGVTLLAANRVSPMRELLASPDPGLIVRCVSVDSRADACSQGELDVRRPAIGQSCERARGPGVWEPVRPASLSFSCRPLSAKSTGAS